MLTVNPLRWFINDSVPVKEVQLFTFTGIESAAKVFDTFTSFAMLTDPNVVPIAVAPLTPNTGIPSFEFGKGNPVVGLTITMPNVLPCLPVTAIAVAPESPYTPNCVAVSVTVPKHNPAPTTATNSAFPDSPTSLIETPIPDAVSNPIFPKVTPKRPF